MSILSWLRRDRTAEVNDTHTWHERDEQRLRGEGPSGVIRAELTAEQCERLIAAMSERAEQLFPDGGDKFDARQQ